jgi:hypothetical protein
MMGKTNDRERRIMEIRAVENDEDRMLIQGYALNYESPATHIYNNRKFTEIIKRGALDEANMTDVPLRYNHNDSVLIMARTRNRSMQLIKNEAGLLIMADLIDTQTNRDLHKCILEGLIDKMSFSFTLPDGGDRWEIKKDESIREITNIEKLWDVSIVDVPFYDSTSIYARSFESLDNEIRRLDSLRELELLKLKIKIKGEL